MKRIELHSNRVMSIHFPFHWQDSFFLLNLTTVMNSTLAITTKDHCAALRCLVHVPCTVNSTQMFYIDIKNLNLSSAEKKAVHSVGIKFSAMYHTPQHRQQSHLASVKFTVSGFCIGH